MKPNLTNLKPTVTTPNNQNEIKKVQEEVANLSPKIMEPQDGGFLENGRSLYVFAGESNVGKSIFLGNIACNLASKGKTTPNLVFSIIAISKGM